MTKQYGILISGHHAGPAIGSLAAARLEMRQLLKEELTLARAKWKSAHLKTWRMGGEITATRDPNSSLWTRIVVVEL